MRSLTIIAYLIAVALPALVAAPSWAQVSWVQVSTGTTATESLGDAQNSAPAHPSEKHRAKELNVFDQFDKPLGQGPHVLVLVFGGGNLRFEYKTGPLCQKAKNIIKEQLGLGSNIMFCVPIF